MMTEREKKERKELVHLYMEDGYYVAIFYGLETGRRYRQSFLWYPKKEVIYKLRHEWNCKCPHAVIDGKTEVKA